MFILTRPGLIAVHRLQYGPVHCGKQFNLALLSARLVVEDDTPTNFCIQIHRNLRIVPHGPPHLLVGCLRPH